MVEILEDRSLLTPAPFVVGSKVFRDGSAAATFTIVLTEINPTQNTTISYQTTLNGTAQANDDFVAIPPSTLVIPAGARSAEVSVSINSADSSDPRTETVELSASLGATTSTAVATLIRTGVDSLPGIEFQDDIISSSDAYLDDSIAEGTSGTKTLNAAIISSSGAFNGDVQVSWTTYPISATNPSDFTAQTGTVTLNATNTSAAIAVPIVTDSTDEFDEYFGLRITAITGNAYIYDPQAVVRIQDDDDLPTVSVTAQTPIAAYEDGQANLSFLLSRGSATSGNLSVNLNVAGSASLPGDYTLTTSNGQTISSANAVVLIPDTQSSITITADPLADTNLEQNETVQLTVASGASYVPDTTANTAFATILTDEPVATISGGGTFLEGTGTAIRRNFTVTITPAPQGAYSIGYQVNHTGSDPTASDDFLSTFPLSDPLKWKLYCAWKQRHRNDFVGLKSRFSARAKRDL